MFHWWGTDGARPVAAAAPGGRVRARGRHAPETRSNPFFCPLAPAVGHQTVWRRTLELGPFHAPAAAAAAEPESDCSDGSEGVAEADAGGARGAINVESGVKDEPGVKPEPGVKAEAEALA